MGTAFVIVTVVLSTLIAAGAVILVAMFVEVGIVNPPPRQPGHDYGNAPGDSCIDLRSQNESKRRDNSKCILEDARDVPTHA